MKSIIITGASEGIGRELARQIAAREKGSAALVLAARNAARLEELATELRPHGSRVEVMPTDVTDREACRRLIAETMTRSAASMSSSTMRVCRLTPTSLNAPMRILTGRKS